MIDPFRTESNGNPRLVRILRPALRRRHPRLVRQPGQLGRRCAKTIGATAARFAAACGFEPKAGRVQWLPDAEGGLAGVLYGLADRGAQGTRSHGAGQARRRSSRGNLPLRQRAARAGARGAGVPARPLSLRALPRRPGAAAASGRARRGRRGEDRAHRRGGRLRPRPRQHARQRPRTRRRWKTRPRGWPKNSAPASR